EATTEEIKTAESLAQHEMDFTDNDLEATDQEMEDKANEIEANADKEVKDWTALKSLETKQSYQRELKLETFIKEQTCYVQITHSHIYKAIRLTACTSQPNEITAYVTLYDKLFDLYQASLNQ
ncbi:MAG: hypothetical protein WC365_06805, partial [Candidatus Babeliales bacterium]